MQKRGTLCRWWLEEGGRKKHVFKTITGRSPPKIKTERKKGKKERAIFQFQARAVSSQECEAKVGLTAWRTVTPTTTTSSPRRSPALRARGGTTIGEVTS